MLWTNITDTTQVNKDLDREDHVTHATSTIMTKFKETSVDSRNADVVDTDFAKTITK